MNNQLKTCLFLSVLSFGLFFLSPQPAAAAVCNEDTAVQFVARDPGGNYIPGARVELYKQVTDANGNPKPGTRVAAASASTVTGIALLKFRNSVEASSIYALKVQVIAKDTASYWYYDLDLSCGQQLGMEKILSGLNISLHDYENKALANTNFNVYAQAYDANGDPTEALGSLIVTAKTDTAGNVKVYVPQGSVRNIGRTVQDHYVIELVRSGRKFYKYGLAVTDEKLTEIAFNVSAMKVTLRTALGALFPNKTKIEVYKQGIDDDDDHVKGDKVGEFLTNDDGYGIFEYKAGIYALAVTGDSGQEEDFWDIEIEEEGLSEYDLQTGTQWQSGNETCKDSVKLNINLLGVNNEALNGFRYDLYEQDTDTLGRPIAGQRIGGGITNSSGRAELTFRPDPRKTYVLRAYDKKADLGEFWFFGAVKFVCGYDRTVTKNLPYLKFILRDSAGSLKKNFSFSLYEQTFDTDNKPVKDAKKLIATLKTGSDGAATVYVAAAHPYNENRRGLYIFSATVGRAVYDVYNIAVAGDKNATFAYTFSNLSVSLKTAVGQGVNNKEVKLYEQKKSGNNYSLGALLASGKTDASGKVSFDYPAGTYALVLADAFNQNNIFWNIIIKDKQANKADLKLNITRISLVDGKGAALAAGSYLKIYSLYASNGSYYKDKEIGSLRSAASKQAEASLAENPYLVSYFDKNKVEYGRVFWAQNGKITTVKIMTNKSQQITAGQKFNLSTPALVTVNNANSISQRLAGYILLQTEDKGQAWYLNPKDYKRYYLADGAAAYSIMRKAGIGITDSDLQKIPIGVDSRFAGNDSDGDLLPDGLEASIGTDPENNDSDGDGYADGSELKNGFDPRGAGKLNTDAVFTNKQKGRILLQIQKNGEAWYVNPQDGYRYYLGDGSLAFQIMRYLSIGISNSNLATVGIGQ